MAFAADTILPETWLNYVFQRLPHWVPLFNSGLITNLQAVGAAQITAGSTFTVPYWNPFPYQSPETESDTIPLTYHRMDSDKLMGVRNHKRYGVENSDLAKLLAGSDPMANVMAEFSEYWIKQLHRYAAGLLNTSAAKLPNTRRANIALTAAGTPTNANRISNGAVSLLRQALGSLYQEDTASNWVLVTHGDVVTDWESRNFITTPTATPLPNTEQVRRISSLPDGIRVVASNGLGRVADANNPGVYKYPVHLLKAGFLGFELNPSITPFEMFRKQDYGVDQLASRLGFIMHPRGYSWNFGIPANYFPSDAEYFDPAHWDIAWDLLNIPFATLTVNV